MRSSIDTLKQEKPSGSFEHRLSLLEAYPGRVSVVREDRTVVFMSKALRDSYGDLVGKKCYETALGSGDVCKGCPVAQNWDPSNFPHSRTAKEPDGTVYELTTTRYEDDETGEVYYFSFERDITVQTEQEQYLRSLAASLDQMAEAVAVADADGRIVYSNKFFETVTGYSRDRLSKLNIMTMEEHIEPEAMMRQVLKDSMDHGWSGEMTINRDGNGPSILHVETKPVKTPEGTAIGIVGLFRDITRERSEKVELEKYKYQLEKKMEARTAELAKRVNQLTTINKISRVVTSIMDPHDLMKEFAKSIASGFGYQHVVVMMMDKDRGELHFNAGDGSKVRQVHRDITIKLKEGIIGHAAFFGETLVTGDVDADPRYVSKDISATKSELAIPIVFRGDLIGVLDIQSDTKDAFTRNDVTLLEMLADILATAIINARTFTESKEREQALTILDRISKQISFRREPAVILDQVAKDAAALLKGEKALVGLKDEGSGHLRWMASCNVEKSLLDQLEFNSARGVTGRAISRLKTEVVNNYLLDPDASQRDGQLFNIKSIVSAPLIIEGKGIGVINVYNKMDGAKFTKSDALFLSSLADHAAIALENSNLLTSLNQRVRSQLALLETAFLMQRQIDSSGIYEYVAEKLREVIWYDALTFYRLDASGEMVVPVLAIGPYTDEVMSDIFPIGVGVTGQVAQTGKAEVINDAISDSRAVQVEGTPLDEEAIMAIPLKGRERVIGVLTVYRQGGKVFTSSEFEIAQLFANQATVAVENAELYKTEETLLGESKKKIEQMSSVLELTTSVMYMDSLDTLLRRLANATVRSFGFKRASVSLLEPEKNVFVNCALAGYPEWVSVGEHMPAEDVLEDMRDEFRVAETSYYVPYEKQDYGIEKFDFIAHPELASKPRESEDAWHERDILMLALKDRSGRLIGYMLVDEPVDMKVPTKEQIEFLEILSGIASIAVENSRLFEKQVFAVNEIALLNDLMTHDINNFNQGIMGYIELLLQDKRLDDGQRRYADKALVQVRNNARIIDNIRKLSKVRAMSDKDFVQWDIYNPIASAVEVLNKSFPDRAVTVASSVPKGAHYVMANQYITDLFQNIISNAVKFDSAKSIHVDVMVSDATDAQGAFWVISVIDRGRGIPDERKKTVFERFATGSTGVKGFGLGLSIVSTIVEKFQGRIWVEDRVPGDFSNGTVFKIMLPKARPPEK